MYTETVNQTLRLEVTPKGQLTLQSPKQPAVLPPFLIHPDGSIEPVSAEQSEGFTVSELRNAVGKTRWVFDSTGRSEQATGLVSCYAESEQVNPLATHLAHRLGYLNAEREALFGSVLFAPVHSLPTL